MPLEPTDPTPRGVRRADFLKGAGALGVAGVVGAAVGTTGTATAAPARHVRQPHETGWRPKKPRLSTPWTDDVSPGNAHPEYPRPQLRRARWLNLNGVWQFAAAGQGEQPPFGKNLPERILVPYPVESPLSGIGRHESRMFYRRRFVVPPSWHVGTGRHDHRLLLNFDAVDYETSVWVNGTKLTTHRGGYDRFTVDVTHALHLRDGAPHGDQEIVVGVFDPTENGVQPMGKQRNATLHDPNSSLYYTPASGIWQTVWLEPVPPRHVERLVLTPHLPSDQLHVRVDTADGPAQVRVIAHDAHGHVVGTASGNAGHDLRIRVRNARHWTPDDPYLYDLTVHVDGGDEVRSYFGMRSVAVEKIDGVPRIVLNGVATFSLSTLQQGYWPDGIYTPATDAAAVFDVEQNKKLGFNTIRKHQKVESDRWYFHADRIGQLVWQDMPATATGQQPANSGMTPPPIPDAGKHEFESELHRMVAQHHNHPSIIMWIPFNEGWGQYDVARIAAQVKRQDPSRVVNEMSGADTAGGGDPSSPRGDAGGGDILDYHNIGIEPPAPVPPTSDGRASLIGEYGAYALAIKGHLWDPKHVSPNVPVDNRKQLEAAYEKITHDIAGYARDQNLSGANYNLFEDAENQDNGLWTYDRKVLKVDADRVRGVNLQAIKAGRRP